MRKSWKIGVLTVATAAVSVVLPVATASAATYGSSIDSCYRIKGNYNDVRVQSAGKVVDDNGVHEVQARVILDVNASSCTRANSIPVSTMTVYEAQLIVNHTYYKSGEYTNHGKSYVNYASTYHRVSCGVPVAVHEKIGYTYYGGAKVRPFWISGKSFYAC